MLKVDSQLIIASLTLSVISSTSYIHNLHLYQELSQCSHQQAL